MTETTLNQDQLREYVVFTQQALSEASKIAMGNFGKVSQIQTKEFDNNQVLTETDLAIGKFLIEQVEHTFPSHNIIDEEAGAIDKQSDFTWVIDPVDGTSNFAVGTPTFGIILGLLYKDVSVAGGIALPFFTEVLVAAKGLGAVDSSGRRLRVSSQTQLKSSLVAFGIDGNQEHPEVTRQHARTLGEVVLKIRNLRATNSCYDTAMVIKGKYGAFINIGSKIWDNVGQQIIVEEAGGVYTDMQGQPMNYARALERINDNFTHCFGAPALHKQLVEIINRPADAD